MCKKWTSWQLEVIKVSGKAGTKEMKRVTFRVSAETLDKIENIAMRYGISVNALCSYVIGRWIEENYDLQEKVMRAVTEAVVTETVMDKWLENPISRKLFEDVLDVVREEAAKA